MTQDAPITDDQLEVLRGIPSQTIIDALWVKGYPSTMIRGGATIADRPADGGSRRYPPLRPPPSRLG